MAELTLDDAAVSARQTWRERRSLIVSIEQDGLIGRGEAAPLPGYSSDSLKDVVRCAKGIPEGAIDLANLERAATSAATYARGLPSLRFALEGAALDLIAQRESVSVAMLLARSIGGAPKEEVSLAAMVGRVSDEGAWARADEAIERGAAAIKLKLDEPEAQLRQLSVPLRLDANRTLETARQLDRVLAHQPEFIEEPFASAWPSRAPDRIALDESLHARSTEGDLNLDALLGEKPASTLVLKPTAIGGSLRCLKLAEEAKARGLRVVVSHTFEGSTAHRHCVALASAVGGGPAGLWPHSALGLGGFPQLELIRGRYVNSATTELG